MYSSELSDLLRKGAGEFGAELDETSLEKFYQYQETLKEWNEKVNLTAIEEDRDIIIKHFVDSLSILPIIKAQGGTLIDIGTGAGFPGIPLKTVYDGINVTLLDSLEKRVKFLEVVIKQLNLQKIRAVHGRAEDFGMNREYREKFDVAVARAVAALPVLLEYCLPFVKTGGIFVAMKGSSTDEVEASGKALDVLGGKIEEIKDITLPFSDIKRNIIVVRKFRQTPTKYPRKAGKPSKNPIS